MALPPRDDPHRPLQLAIRSLQTLGVACVIFGFLVVAGGAIFNPYHLYRWAFWIGGILLWLGPGVVYVVCIGPLRRHRLPALVVALITAAGQMLLAAGLFVANFFLTPLSPIPIVLSGLWVVALAQLLLHLGGGFAAMKIDANLEQRGFEPLAVRPADPPARPVAMETFETRQHF
jgi:hypothetical protein